MIFLRVFLSLSGLHVSMSFASLVAHHRLEPYGPNKSDVEQLESRNTAMLKKQLLDLMSKTPDMKMFQAICAPEVEFKTSLCAGSGVNSLGALFYYYKLLQGTLLDKVVMDLNEKSFEVWVAEQPSRSWLKQVTYKEVLRNGLHVELNDAGKIKSMTESGYSTDGMNFFFTPSRYLNGILLGYFLR